MWKYLVDVQCGLYSKTLHFDWLLFAMIMVILQWSPSLGIIFVLFQTASIYLTQAELDLRILLTELPEYWGSRHFLSYPTIEAFCTISIPL